MGVLRDFGLPELMIILVIIIILFGPGRIGRVAGELGKGIRSFKDGLNPNKTDQETQMDNAQEKPQEITKEK